MAFCSLWVLEHNGGPGHSTLEPSAATSMSAWTCSQFDNMCDIWKRFKFQWRSAVLWWHLNDTVVTDSHCIEGRSFNEIRPVEWEVRWHSLWGMWARGNSQSASAARGLRYRKWPFAKEQCFGGFGGGFPPHYRAYRTTGVERGVWGDPPPIIGSKWAVP